MLKREVVDKTIGKTFADKLDEKLTIIFGVEISKRIMVEEMGCANFQAAVRLGKALKKLDIHTPAQLHKTSPFDLARLRTVGEATIYVAMCILDSHEYDVEKWWGWKDTNDLKFSSFKHSAMRRAKKNGHSI
jgi:hypothetical protein